MNLYVGIYNYYYIYLYSYIFIGEASAGMFNHKDTLRAPTYQIQLSGAKQWHLCDASQSELIGTTGAWDAFHPNYVLFPDTLKLSCQQGIVNEGDLIYYPEGIVYIIYIRLIDLYNCILHLLIHLIYIYMYYYYVEYIYATLYVLLYLHVVICY